MPGGVASGSGAPGRSAPRRRRGGGLSRADEQAAHLLAGVGIGRDERGRPSAISDTADSSAWAAAIPASPEPSSSEASWIGRRGGSGTACRAATARSAGRRGGSGAATAPAGTAMPVSNSLAEGVPGLSAASRSASEAFGAA